MHAGREQGGQGAAPAAQGKVEKIAGVVRMGANRNDAPPLARRQAAARISGTHEAPHSISPAPIITGGLSALSKAGEGAAGKPVFSGAEWGQLLRPVLQVRS